MVIKLLSHPIKLPLLSSHNDSTISANLLMWHKICETSMRFPLRLVLIGGIIGAPKKRETNSLSP